MVSRTDGNDCHCLLIGNDPLVPPSVWTLQVKGLKIFRAIGAGVRASIRGFPKASGGGECEPHPDAEPPLLS